MGYYQDKSAARSGPFYHQPRGLRNPPGVGWGCAPATNRDRRRDERIVMAAKIIDGKALAARIRGELAAEAKQLSARGCQPALAVILVGEDPASQIRAQQDQGAGRGRVSLS